MNTKVKRSKFANVAAWLLSTLTAVVSFVFIFVFAHLIGAIGLEGDTGVHIAYGLYGIVVAIACFWICKIHPKSIWYSIIICISPGIFPVIGEDSFWERNLWIVFVGIWTLSILAGIIGMVIGKRQGIEPEQ